MLNAQLIALSRQMSLKREMDVIANNLANMNTTGFRAEQMAFEEVDMPFAQASAFPRRLDQNLAYVRDFATIRDLRQGPIKTTGNPLDVAISGDGYFALNTSQGERFTRNGAFTLNNEGLLSTHDGAIVMGLDGVIAFTPNDTNITIAGDGTVSTDNGIRGTLRIVSFESEQTLQKEGSNLYRGDNPLPVDQPSLVQGAVEGSNTQPISEMARMVEVQRAYAMQANLVKDQDGLRRSAIERLGNLNS